MVFRVGRGLLRTLAIVFVTSCAVLTPASAQTDVATAYRLGTGDKVRVTVYNEPTLSGAFDVNDQGVGALGRIGPVAIAGKTIREAQTLITERYAKDYLVNPRV